MTKLAKDERQRISTAFTSLKGHETQTVYLRGCISVNPDIGIRRRPRKENAKEQSSFSYSVTVQEQTVSICKAAFLGMHESRLMKESRLKRKVLSFLVLQMDAVNTAIIKRLTKIFESV